MKKAFTIKTVLTGMLTIFTLQNLHAQCYYVPSTSTITDSMSYTFAGGSFASFGCAPIDPTFWMSGSGNSVTVNFVNPETNPTFRVWGMNDDDVASVTVNGVSYPLTTLSASYDAKVVCGISPGPDGVIFTGGNLVGANSNTSGNYSYQNVQLIASGVNTITVTGLTGAGWGFAGSSINCPLQTLSTTELSGRNLLMVYPNPGNGEINVKSSFLIDDLLVTDMSGRIIFAQHPDEKNILLKLDNPGIYFLTVVSDKQTATTRLTVCK